MTNVGFSTVDVGTSNFRNAKKLQVLEYSWYLVWEYLLLKWTLKNSSPSGRLGSTRDVWITSSFFDML